MSYITEKEKFIKLVKEYDAAKENRDKLEESIKDVVSIKSLMSMFDGLGEVCLEKGDYYYDDDKVYLVNDLIHMSKLVLMSYKGRNKDLINTYKIPFANKDYDVFPYIDFNCKTFPELEKKVKEIKDFITKFNEARNSVNILDLYKNYTDEKEKAYSINNKIDDQYFKCKEAYIKDKYGHYSGDIAIGKTYFLLDTKCKEKIALVEVLSKDDSGLGYKCVDHEADDKKYTHVKPSRLCEDLREFPSRYNLELEARG